MTTNLNQNNLNIAVNQDPPYFTFEFINKTLRIKTGINVEILKTLSEKLNFTYTLIDCKGMWGSLLPNNTWTGIIGALNTKQADIGLADVAMTQERSKVVKFAFPHMISKLTFITTLPEYYTRLTLNLFEPIILKFLLITIVILGISLYCFSKVWKCENFSNITWIIFCTAIKQSVSISRIPQILSFEMLYSFWLIFSLIFLIMFGDCTYSEMALPRRFKTIDTIEKLSKEKLRGHITLSLIKDHYLFQLMKESNEESFRSLSDSMEFMENEKKGFEAVINSKSPRAYIIVLDTVQYFNQKNEQGAFYLPPPFETTFFMDLSSIAFRKDFQYLQAFNKMLLEMREAGLFHIWRKKSGANDNFMKMKQDSNHLNLNMDNFQIYFYILLFGNALSSLIILLELFKLMLEKFKKSIERIICIN